MEIAMELEDDVFFADLSKQISLLIMDDDEELINHSPPLSFEAFSQPIHQAPRMQYLQEHNQQPIYRRECKGTGVFIPRSSTNPRKKNKQQQDRCNNNNSKYNNNNNNKQINNSRSGFYSSPHEITHSSYYNNSSSRTSSYFNNIDSFNDLPRRFE